VLTEINTLIFVEIFYTGSPYGHKKFVHDIFWI
jgi:hypothetical protein